MYIFSLIFCIYLICMYLSINIYTIFSSHSVILELAMSKLSLNHVIQNFENFLRLKLNKYFGSHKKDYEVNRQVDSMRTELKEIEIFHRQYIKESSIIAASSASKSMPIFLIKEMLESKLTVGRSLVVVYFITKLCKQYVAMQREDLIDNVIEETKMLFGEFSSRNTIQKYMKLGGATFQYTIITASFWFICKSIYNLV